MSTLSKVPHPKGRSHLSGAIRKAALGMLIGLVRPVPAVFGVAIAMSLGAVYIPAAQDAGGFFVAESIGGSGELDEVLVDLEDTDDEFFFFAQPFLNPALAAAELLDYYGMIDETQSDVSAGFFTASLAPSPETKVDGESREPIRYVVEEGDTVSSIAASFGISGETLVWTNNLLNPDQLKPGQELLVLPVSGVFHTVKSSESVLSIAAKYHTDARKIITFNGLPADGQVEAGSQIIVPDGVIVVPKPPPRPSSTTSRYANAPTSSQGFLSAPTTGRRVRGITRYHRGVDIANNCGTPVYAAASGLVGRADGSGWNGGFGKVIVIQHSNGTETLYAHLSSIVVSEGQEIGQGAYLGTMGTTGRSSGCHLHFEVHGAKNPF